MNLLDKLALAVAPSWGLSRVRARAMAQALQARNYEAASGGRRTQNWSRRASDANVAAGAALGPLRMVARDLVRNNAWAANGLQVITRNTVGYGLSAKPVGADEAITAAWKAWSGTTQCDATGRLPFSGIQALVMRCVVESGEVLIRRRWRQPRDGMDLPLALEVLEPDFLDDTRDNFIGIEGGPCIRGVEFDAIGRRVAYWLFDQHPGSSLANPSSKRVAASSVAHVYRVSRPGQVRAASWFAPVVVSLKDFDEYEDAEIMRQKIAACLAGFITDMDGGGAALGEQSATDPLVESFEPGMIQRLKPGEEITFSNPPTTTDMGFSARTLRRIAAGLGVTYEDLTNDYSQVNFSSARMSRLAHWANVSDWTWNMLVPQFCDVVWGWAMDAAVMASILPSAALRPSVEWTPQPMPLIEPDKEAQANLHMIRSGQKTLSQVLREQGLDRESHLAEYAADLKELDKLGIWLDSDVRRVSQAGLTQERVGLSGGGDSPPPKNGAAAKPAPVNGAAKPSA